MKRVEKRTEQREVEHTVEYTCDVCGTPNEQWKKEFDARVPHGLDEWRGPCNDASTEVELTASWGWADCGTGKHWEMDVCPLCMLTVVFPFIASKRGAQPRVRETNW